jgi:hypothetical protein
MNTPAAKVMLTQVELTGKVLVAQVVPSAETAATVDGCAIATKTPLP